MSECIQDKYTCGGVNGTERCRLFIPGTDATCGKCQHVRAVWGLPSSNGVYSSGCCSGHTGYVAEKDRERLQAVVALRAFTVLITTNHLSYNQNAEHAVVLSEIFLTAMKEVGS